MPPPSTKPATAAPIITCFWLLRRCLRNNQKQVMIGAAVAGFVLGGGVAAMTGLMMGRRRRDYY